MKHSIATRNARSKAAAPAILAFGFVLLFCLGTGGCSAQEEVLEARIQRIESGLLPGPGIVIAGRPWPEASLADRMGAFRVPGVSIAVFRDFEETVRGIGDAARSLSALGTDEPVAIVSGNVSFYNESHSGSAVPPSPVIACYGVLEDFSRSVSLCLKRPGSELVLVGDRKQGLGGSALSGALGRQGEGSLPGLDLKEERAAIHSVARCIMQGYVLACHDISDGGLAVALAEMIMGGWGGGRVGAEISLDFGRDLSTVELLFSESGGFVLEAVPGGAEDVLRVCAEFGAPAYVIGTTTERHALVVTRRSATEIEVEGSAMLSVWRDGLEKSIR